MTRGRANDEDAHLIPIFPEFRKLRERLYEPELESQVLAFFMKSLLDGADNWLALRERDPQFADELWNATSRFRLGVQQTFILAERRSVVVLSKEGLKRLSWTEALGTHLVKPTPEWTIEVRQEPMKL
jgi:hypothetical protein